MQKHLENMRKLMGKWRFRAHKMNLFFTLWCAQKRQTTAPFCARAKSYPPILVRTKEGEGPRALGLFHQNTKRKRVTPKAFVCV